VVATKKVSSKADVDVELRNADGCHGIAAATALVKGIVE